MYNPTKIDKEVLEFWNRNQIFNKLKAKNKGKKKWSFLDGPITANNQMGVHHAWGRTYKDVFQRLKAMQGYDQRYQNGFDCQGLWIEREEEKVLGLKNKADIERFGILNFVKACKTRVQKFSKIQTEQSIRLGQWMNWDNSYYTMSDTNNLHNWFLIKKYFDKGWLYKGEDAVPWCWRCGTASSKHDIVTEGYKEVTHSGVFMQFPLKNEDNEYFLIFTTTPWTVPANVAIAVNADLIYVKVKNQGAKYWLAESRLNELEEEYKILEKKKGKELKGIEYIMPYRDIKSQAGSPHKVVLWELASSEEGTGIVHIAPGCGKEDYELGKKEKLPTISPLDEAGVFKEGFGEFSLRKYSEVNNVVLNDLEQTRFAYKIISYKHRYPHCWRCGEELVFRLVDEWYIQCKEIRKKLIAQNKKIKWSPEYGKIRQEEWFKAMGDWLISRKRYWGLPLPIWECECGEIKVFGSLKELREKALDKKKVDELPELHRPWIDEILIKCEKCGKNVKRILDVGDAWLDAGIVPLSTIGTYLENKGEWEKWYPVDFICENMPGQYRGWFNALMWASVTLTGKAPFKSILGYETLKDEKGEEMHKSKGNAIWFDEAVEKIGADPMRLLYCLQDPAQELRFGYNVLKEPNSSINILYNLSNLIENKNGKVKKLEDEWIISRLNSLIKEVTEHFEELNPHLATRALQNFWLNDLSRGYVQLIRERIAADDNAKYVIKEVYLELLKLIAPIMPLTTEKLWQDLRLKIPKLEESVHLTKWPKTNEKLIDKNLEKSIELAKKIIETGMAIRDKEKINVRWPLMKAEIEITNKNEEKSIKKVENIIKQQLNVKKIEIKFNKKDLSDKIEDGIFQNGSVRLDFEMNKELEEEGYSREIMRRVQSLRKEAGLKKEDQIELFVNISNVDLSKWKKSITERCGAKKLEFKINQNLKHKTDGEIKGNKFNIGFDKI